MSYDPRSMRRWHVLLPILVAATAVIAVLGVTLLTWSTPIARFKPVAPAAVRLVPPADNQHQLYVLDGWGGVHPVGDAPSLKSTAAWPTRDIAYSLALFPDGSGGYVMDGWGGLHPLGDAPPVDSGVYWPNWIGAREIVLAPWSSTAFPAGYLLDADGGIHPFGGAPEITGNTTWPQQGIARALLLTSDSTAWQVKGYTLDGFGGVHPFGGARPVFAAAHWNEDIARGMVLIRGRNSLLVQGYTLDYSGGVHPFGGAPAVTASAAWPGQDMADSIAGWTAAPAGMPGGWVLDRHGGVHQFGSAPSLAPSQTWPGWDIARGLAGAGSGGGSTERLILEPETISDSFGTYFNQRDQRWATENVGAAAYQVWKIGCLISDLAMVYSHFGFRTVNPGTIAAHAGWFNLGGAIYNSALNIPGHTMVMVRNPDSQWIRDQVAAGRPVIVGMNTPAGTTHFVTITGLDGPADYWVDDPWEQNAMHVTFSGDWSDRGPIYEAIVFF